MKSFIIALCSLLLWQIIGTFLRMGEPQKGVSVYICHNDVGGQRMLTQKFIYNTQTSD